MAEVRLYTIPTCPHCMVVREYLRRRNVEFEEYNVNDDYERWREAISKTGGLDVVPVIDIDGQILFGAFTTEFEKRLSLALEQAG